MATVTSITAARAEEIYNASIVSAELSGNNLVLRTRGGAAFTLPNVKASALDAWPVGCIFTHTTSTNPATLLGGGTWARFGQGRVLVSQDGSQTEFDTVLEEGGEKTHTLTEAELAAHTHPQPQNANAYVDPATATIATGFNNFSQTGSIDGETGSTGDGDAHNNLQPYIVVYMWKRTA